LEGGEFFPTLSHNSSDSPRREKQLRSQQRGGLQIEVCLSENPSQTIIFALFHSCTVIVYQGNMNPTDRELAYSRTTIDQLLLKGFYTRPKYHRNSSVYEFKEPLYIEGRYLLARPRNRTLGCGQAKEEMPWLKVIASIAAVMPRPSLLPAFLTSSTPCLPKILPPQFSTRHKFCSPLHS